MRTYKFELEEYCENCPEFECDIYEEYFVCGCKKKTIRYIRCSHQNKCENFMHFINSKEERNGD